MPNENTNTNGWTTWGMHVLEELKRLNEVIEKHEKKMEDKINDLYDIIGELRTEVAMLKVKAGVWGALGGLVPVLIAMTIALLVGMFKQSQ